MADQSAARYSSQDYLKKLRDRRNQRAQEVSEGTTDTSLQPGPQPQVQPASPQGTPPAQPDAHRQPRTAPQIPPQQPLTVTPIHQQKQPVPTQPQQQPATAQPDQANQTSNENPLPEDLKPQPEKMVVEWVAPSRPFKKRNRQFYSTVAIITLLISLILFFAGQFLPIAVVISVAFLAYVLYSVPPDNIRNQITTYGIRTQDTLYYWEELGRFWLDTTFGQDVIHLEVARFPGQLTLLTGELSKEDLADLLSRVLLQEKPPDTFLDKSANWLQDKIPLE